MSDERVPGTSVIFGLGWSHWLPHTGDLMYIAIACDEHPSVVAPLSESPWRETDDEAEKFSDDEQRQLNAALKERVNRQAARYGISINTNDDVLEFMRQLGLLEFDSQGWRTVDSPPLPEDVFDLSTNEREREDRMRWLDLHYGSAQSIIGLFVDNEADTVRSSLAALAAKLDLEVDSIREGIAILLYEKDFSMTADPATIPSDEEFDLNVDWVKFDEVRISVRVNFPR